MNQVNKIKESIIKKSNINKSHINENKLNYIKAFVFVLFFLGCCLLPQINSYAADDSAVKPIEEFDNLSEQYKYLGKDYRDNYYLDMEETGLLDVGWMMINAIANMLFSFIRWVAYLLCSTFFQVMDFNIADLLSPQINAMQKALNNAIFLPLFTLACCGAFCVLIVKMLKRDLVSAGLEIAKIIGVVLLSFLVIAKSDVALTAVTQITKEISLNALISVNSTEEGESTTSAFAAEAAGLLWKSLVHDPWLSLEFGSDPIPEGAVDEILYDNPPQSGKREDYIEGIALNEEGEVVIAAMGMKNAGNRIGFLIAYLIPFLLKSMVYLLMALLQLVFQLLAVFYLILAPVVLILVLVPGYESMLGIWLRKMLESQISILIITFVMGLVIKVDGLLYALTPEFGWFIVLIFQVALGIGLFLFRDKLLGAISTMKRGATNAVRGISSIQRASSPDYMMMRMGRVGRGGMYMNQRTHVNYNMPRGSMNHQGQHQYNQETELPPPPPRKYKPKPPVNKKPVNPNVTKGQGKITNGNQYRGNVVPFTPLLKSTQGKPPSTVPKRTLNKPIEQEQRKQQQQKSQIETVQENKGRPVLNATATQPTKEKQQTSPKRTLQKPVEQATKNKLETIGRESNPINKQGEEKHRPTLNKTNMVNQTKQKEGKIEQKQKVEKPLVLNKDYPQKTVPTVKKVKVAPTLDKNK